jgi:tetratricopeptide (TPR) repeat protein
MNDDNELPDIDTLWDYSHPDVSEARFRELLPRAERSGDRDYHLQLMTQIARAQGLGRRYDEAHATLDGVCERLGDDLPRVRVRYLLERGRCFNDTKKHADARACFVEAWELARAKGLDGLAVDAAHMMGIIEPGDEALAWNLKAMGHAKGSSDPKARRWLASLQNNIGWTYHGIGQYEKALEVFEDALRLRVEQGKPENIRIARWSVAKMHRLLGRAEQALETQRQLHDELAAIDEPDGYVFEETGECLLALGRGEEARHQFARAYELLSKDAWFVANEGTRLERLKNLGGIA